MIAWLKECGSNFRLTSRIHVIPNGSIGENTKAEISAVVKNL